LGGETAVTTRRAAAVLTVLALVAAMAWVTTHRFGRPEPARAGACTVQADGEVSLDPEQMANAATITAVGVRMDMPDRAVVVALATAMQESKLENIDYGDRDSVGLFQQRPSQGWGTVEQILDPRYAAERFYSALVRIGGWEELRVTDAAQAVQRSAFPEAYQQWAGEADVLATALLGHATGAVACNLDGEPPVRGADAASALGAGLAADWGELATSALGDAPGLAVAPENDRAGWRYAHWLVSHAAGHGVVRVHFGDLEWTAATGTWSEADSAADHVRADVRTEA
jgi:hypothetical protein